jgi:hypothetical protein
LENLTEPEYYFHLTLNSNSDLPNYVKILVKQNEYKDIINNYIITYYNNDNTFKSREQISISKPIIDKVAYMWLNKEQIKNGFYFKVEVQNNKIDFSNFQIDIIRYNYIELNLNNPIYKYYVTKENKQMNFIVKANEDFFKKEDNNNVIIIWVDGKKEISVNIDSFDYVKHSKYNAFIIHNIKDYKEYIVSINGNIGDLIDIGTAFIYKNKLYYYYAYDAFSIEDVLKIFLKKNILEEICFQHYDNIKFINDDNKDKNDILNKIDLNYNQNNRCIKLPDEIEELYFFNHFLWFFGYPLTKNSPVYFSLLTGMEYYQIIPKKNTIGYIPLNIEEDFNFLTYKIYT